MSRTIRNEDHATFSYTGTWSTLGSSGIWGSTPLTPATSGTVKFSNVAGSFCRVVLPVHHGFTSCAIIGHGASTNNPNATITVDTVLNQTWNQKFGSLADPEYYLPRILSQPIVLIDSAATQVIDITVGNGGGNLIIDGIELYTAEAQVAGRLTSFGHSMLYGVTSSGDGTVQSGRFTQLFGQYLAKQLALAVTDDNQGVPSEDLIGGSYQSGVSPAYPSLVNTRYYNNPAIYTPGWMRNDQGDLWPNPIPGTGSGFIVPNWITGTGSSANYMPGVAQWWARKFQVGVLMHGYNDMGYPEIFDAGSAIPVANRDATPHTTAPAAGAGYSKASFQQRFRELLYRATMNIIGNPPIFVCGVANYNNGARQTNGIGIRMDGWLRELIADPFFVGKNITFVDLLPATTGLGSVNVSGGDPHPNILGHRLIADELSRAWDRTHNIPAMAGRST